MRSIVVLTAASFLPVAAACALIWLANGSLPPHLIDQCDSKGNPGDSASIVIVGVLVSDTLVLRPVPMHSNPEYPLQLHRLGVRVENVLKGDVSRGTVAVYYFTFEGTYEGPQTLGAWRVESRRILWLRRDAGVLRTVCDGWDGCTWGVYSGAHPHFTVAPQKPIAYAVADILLTRGEGKVDDSRFAGALQWGAPSPEDYLIEKYQHLALTEGSPVKTAACIQLWICAQDRGASQSSRNIAREAMRQANCRCITKPDGTPDCGANADINSDPPL
jgi:hypothetical protein